MLDRSAESVERESVMVCDKDFREHLAACKIGKHRWMAAAFAAVMLFSVTGCGTEPDAESSVSSQPSDTETSTSVPKATATPSQSVSSSASPSSIASQETSSGSSAVSVLSTLPVKGRAPKTGYSRDQFGAAWADVDHNGCDTRNDILRRDLRQVTAKDGTHGCVILSGVLNDPYTATRINFQRGQRTSSAVQIDHVVALSDAWQKGAQQLAEESRQQLANDPYNLLAVDGPANQQKSDGDAATWLPSNKAFRCEYVARQIGVKSKYHLWVTQAEKSAMQTVLSSCPTQTVPADDGVQTPVKVRASQSATPRATNKTAASPRATSRSPQPTKQQAAENTYYKNCAAVRAAGKAPLTKGQPGYDRHLDRDGDGVACE